MLLDVVKASEPSTIVSVSSVAHHASYKEGIRLSLEKLNSEELYVPFTAYGQSKLANIYFVQELAERMKSGGHKVYVNAIHPGAVNTDIVRHFPKGLIKVYKKIVDTFQNTFVFESDYAALGEVYAAISPNILKNEISGKYIVPIGQIVETNKNAQDKKMQKDLWKFTETIIKEKGF